MQKVNYFRGNWHNAVFISIAIFTVFADQVSKTWIRVNLPYGHSLFDIGFFRITNISNTGASFGLFPDQSFVLTIVAFIGIIVIVLGALLGYRYLPILNNMLGKVALGLLLGGTVGNLTDRLRFGYVTDFIDFKVWPTFNIADSAVTVGSIIFVYSILRMYANEKR